MTPDTLKPCPWCGEKPEQFNIFDAFRCPSESPCSKNGGWMKADDWNRRTPAPKVDMAANIEYRAMRSRMPLFPPPQPQAAMKDKEK